MAARRIADEIADGIAERDPRPEGFLGRRGREGGTEARRRREAGGLVRELAKEIAEESNPNPDPNPNPNPNPVVFWVSTVERARMVRKCF